MSCLNGRVIACLSLCLLFLGFSSAIKAQQNQLPPVIVERLKKARAAQLESARRIQNTEENLERASEGARLPSGQPLTQTTAGSVDGYRATGAVSATKTETPIEQIPQSIQVIPRSVLVDQRAITVDEAVRNVSGVEATNPLQTPAYESAKIRGFAAETWIDGFVNYYNAGDRDSVVNIERIEVLKGPNALLYGGGAGSPVGGAINIVSKLPTDKASGEIGVKFGSYGFAQPYFDINQPITRDGTVLFRMTGEYTRADNFVDVIETKRYSLNPTWVFTNKTDTTLTVQARVSEWKQPEYQGLPATGTIAGGFRIRRDLFIGPDDIPDSFSRQQGVTVTFDHKIDPVWSFNIKARIGYSEFQELAQSIVGSDGFAANVPLQPLARWGLLNLNLFQEQKEISVNPNLTAKFDWLGTRNTVLIGGDYSRLIDQGYLAAGFLPDVVDLRNPTFPAFVDPTRALASTDSKNIYETSGAYAQLQSTISDRLHLLGGVRVSNVKITPFDNLTQSEQAKTDGTKILPRGGAVLDITNWLSIYGSYSQGQKANPFFIYIDVPKAETSEQVEGGFKFNINSQLTGTLAFFEINRKNVPVTVPNTFLSSATGEQRSRGFEADVIWQPSTPWQFIASYAYIEAEFAKDDPASGALKGNRLIDIPEHSGRLWANYKFQDERLKGFSIGAGIYAASSQAVDVRNRFSTDAYYTIDAKAAYETEKYAAAFTVKNLTANEYFVPYSYFGGRVAPVDGPSVYATFAVKY